MSKENTCIIGSVGTCITQETECILNSPKDKSLLKSISITLMDVLSNNHLNEHYKKKLKSQSKQIFTSKTIPKISLGDYINRILKYTKIEDSTLIITLIYIDRFCKNKKILLTEFNIHRIFFSALLVSIKYNEDKYYSNLYYSKIGGLKLHKLNKLESEFLLGLAFKLFIDDKVYKQYETNLLCSLNECDNNEQFSILTKGVLLGC